MRKEKRLDRWIHIDFWFKRSRWNIECLLTKKEQRHFEELLALFIRKCGKLVKRKFYLYEDIPHCFLALEVKEKDIEKIDRIRKKMFIAPYFYKHYTNKLAGNDLDNGQGFLNIFNAFTDFYLFNKDNSLTHVIHCCLEFMTQSRKEENRFYRMMSILYQSVKMKNNKPIYSFRKITPQLKTKLHKYMDEMDLRKRII